MKAVMIRTSKKECVEIVAEKQTILVRKTMPKLETPFKCYIYCTKGKPYLYREANGKKELFLDNDLYRGGSYEARFLSGKVIGEFVCDRITKYPYEPYTDGEHLVPYDDFEQIGMDGWELYDYLRVKDGYGWHISDLKIYDEPKELSDFGQKCRYAQYQDDEYYGGWFCNDEENGEDCGCFDCPSCGGESCGYEDFAYCLGKGIKPLKRPPQNWQYVEEVEK